VQRFGDALNLHFHSLALDGVYARSEGGAPCFLPLPPPDDAEVERVARQEAAISRPRDACPVARRSATTPSALGTRVTARL
jgi:hypothetical protein